MKLDLPQLHVISYNPKEKFFEFDYLPENNQQLMKLKDEYLCMNIRHSADGKFYQLIQQCLTIQNQRVYWSINRDFPFLKLAICSKKSPNICGQDIEMKEGTNLCLRFI